MSSEGLKVSVIICTYKRLNDLYICLKSLESQLIKPDEVIIVDDGDTVETEKMLRNDTFKRLKHIKNKEKRGLPAARNVGVEHAQGDIICFIDDDVILPPTWLQEIITGYEDNKDAVGVGGYALNIKPRAPLGNTLKYRLLSAIRLVFFNKKVGKLSFLGIPYAVFNIMPDGYVKVDLLQGCNMSFKREVFNLHRFDELYEESAVGEEQDFCTRLTKKNGKKLIYNPNAVVIHKCAQSGGCRVGDRFYWMVRNHIYYLLKNFNSKYLRVALYSIFVMIYSIFTFKLIYLRAIKDGIKQYKQFRGKHEK